MNHAKEWEGSLVAKNRSSLVPFFALTFFTSWAIWSAMLLWPSLRGVSPALLICIGAYAPTVWGVYFTHRRSGGEGLRDLFARFLLFRAPILWVFSAILLAPLCFTFSAGLVRLFVGEWPEFSLDYLTPPFVLGILALGGPLNEELGWRGFALPRLLRGRSPLAASIVLGVLWALWHLPLFFVPGATQQGVPLANFVIVVLCFSVFMTAAHRRSGGSLLIAVLFHTSVNTSLGMWHFDPGAPTRAYERWVSFQPIFLCLMLPWILVASAILVCERRLWFVASSKV